MAIKTILVSQPKPEGEKSPYFDLATKYKLKIDFRPFIKVESVDSKDFRSQRVNLSEQTAIILTSKVAVGLSLSFFIVLSSTVAGMRGVSQDHLTLCKTLGAKPTTIFFKVTLPGAIPIIFSGLRLGLIYSLLGVVGTEIVASEHGIGQKITSLATSFNANGVMALVFVLAFLGVVIVRLMTSIEIYLSRWK